MRNYLLRAALLRVRVVIVRLFCIGGIIVSLIIDLPLTLGLAWFAAVPFADRVTTFLFSGRSSSSESLIVRST